MPKKLKLKLSDLKVQSFITSLKDEESDKIMGASGVSYNPGCMTTCGDSYCLSGCTGGVPCTNTCPAC